MFREEACRKQHEAFCRALTKRLNILVVEDDEQILDLFVNLLDCSLFDLHTASTFSDAQRVIRGLRKPWHCWVLDYGLDNGNTALGLFPEANRFPYIVVVSGRTTRAQTSEATRLGALHVLDKGDATGAEIVDMVSRVSALGYVLKGQRTDPHEKIFHALLFDPTITDARIWASKTSVSERTIDTVCSEYCGMRPIQVLAYYHVLLEVVRRRCMCSGGPPPRSSFVLPDDYVRFALDAVTRGIDEPRTLHGTPPNLPRPRSVDLPVSAVS